jgi:drug/metabolite transporter (DMT)-like permease
VSRALVVATLAVLAAFLFALAAFLQQRAARTPERLSGSAVRRLGTLMSRLLRSRTWLAGWIVNLCGFFAQASALQLGSVAAVQPLMPTQLLFALPMSSMERHRWPRLQDWASAAAICGGVAVLLTTEGAAPLTGEADRSRVLMAAALVLLIVVLVLTTAPRLSRTWASVLTAATAGLCFAMSAVFMKLTSGDLIDHGVAYTARDWPGYALAVSTLLGLVIEQGAFSSGPLPWSIAIMNTVNPVASYAAGVLAFRVHAPDDLGSISGIAGAGVLLVVGAIGLAHSSSGTVWFPDEYGERSRQDDSPREPTTPSNRSGGNRS